MPKWKILVRYGLSVLMSTDARVAPVDRWLISEWPRARAVEVAIVTTRQSEARRRGGGERRGKGGGGRGNFDVVVIHNLQPS